MTGTRVAVVGAGWAGLAAAVRLLDAGCVPTVFEAAREAGGRARRVDWELEPGVPLALDNGQHILLGAYRETLALMQRVGVDPGSVLARRPLALQNVSGFRLAAPRLPAPLHVLVALLGVRGMTLGARAALVRLMVGARLSGWRIDADRPLAEWLREQRQPATLVRDLWGPLCVAALNTPIDVASTQVFLNVLRDSLGAHSAASDLLLPRACLDLLLPRAAQSYLARGGAAVRLGQRVHRLILDERGVDVVTAEGAAERFDAIVIAVAGHQVGALLQDPSCRILSALAAQCDAFSWQPITTAYLLYPDVPAFPLPMMALAEDSAKGDFGQWAFDKARLGGPRGLVAVVISAAGPHQELDHASLLGSVERQLARQLGLPSAPLAARAISEKRATFACLPGLTRPTNRSPAPRLVLAGDYTAGDYPATLESAVRSGRDAADALLDQLRALA